MNPTKNDLSKIRVTELREQYSKDGLIVYLCSGGETLDLLARCYAVPLPLMQLHNRGIKSNSTLKKGKIIKIPAFRDF